MTEQEVDFYSIYGFRGNQDYHQGDMIVLGFGGKEWNHGYLRAAKRTKLVRHQSIT